MPHILKFAVYQCGECGEIFKREDMIDKHCKRLGHRPIFMYTLVVRVNRPSNRLKYEVIEGKAETGYL